MICVFHRSGDGECAQLARPLDRRLGLAIGRIRCPCCFLVERDARLRADDLFHMRPRAGPFDVADDIAVRIQYANFGEGDER